MRKFIVFLAIVSAGFLFYIEDIEVNTVPKDINESIEANLSNPIETFKKEIIQNTKKTNKNTDKKIIISDNELLNDIPSLDELDELMKDGYIGTASYFNELSIYEKEAVLHMQINEHRIIAIADLYNSFNDEGFLSYLGNDANKNLNKLMKDKKFNVKVKLLKKLLELNDDEMIITSKINEERVIIYEELLLYNMANPESTYKMFFNEYIRLKENFS